MTWFGEVLGKRCRLLRVLRARLQFIHIVDHYSFVPRFTWIACHCQYMSCCTEHDSYLLVGVCLEAGFTQLSPDTALLHASERNSSVRVVA